MAYSLGIDLGTTLSAAATARDGLIEIVQLGEQTATMPSIVVVRAGVEVLVGDAAERESANEPSRTARGFKRRLGDPDPIILGGEPYGAEALLAHVLRAIVARVSEGAGAPPDAIVVTHPASYGPDKIALLEGAVRQAGLENVTFLTEPEAAAIHDDQRDPLTVGSFVAVYDFGGGTFDAAILRKTETGFEEVGTSEEMEHLGGIDFDDAFSSSVVGFVSANGIAVDADDPATAAALVRLRDEGRRAKEALSSEPETTVHVDLPGFQTELPLTREDFEDLIRPHIAETIGALARATESAGLTFHGLDRVLLIGGSSRIPLVAEMVGEATDRPITVDPDSKDSIALGAAFVAEQRRLAAETDAEAAAAAAGVVGTGSILGMEAAAAMDAVVADEPDAAPPTEVVPVVAAEPAATSTTETVAPAAQAAVLAGVRDRTYRTADDRLGGGARRPGPRPAARGRRLRDAVGCRVVEPAGLRRARQLGAIGRAIGLPHTVGQRGPDIDSTPIVERSLLHPVRPRPVARHGSPGSPSATGATSSTTRRSGTRRLCPGRTCTSSSTPCPCPMPACPGQARGSCTPGRRRSPATRSATSPRMRPRCASSSRTPTIRSSRTPGTAWSCRSPSPRARRAPGRRPGTGIAGCG